MTLLKDLIEIPEHVQQGDFVLRLAEGVTRPDETLREYVVTPQLEGCFDDALGFIKGALQSKTSKAAYLHGSFGSGKSHFMAVLHLLLQGNPRRAPSPSWPRSSPGTTLDRRQEVPAGALPHDRRRTTWSRRILGGYVDYIRRTHPEAPIPGVYLAEGLFDDADDLREQMGDEPFFEALNEGSASGGELGRRSTGLGCGSVRGGDGGAARLRRARAAGRRPDRERSSARMTREPARSGEASSSLDEGLSIMSQHAPELGYDALILFLDELILWLASRAADLRFVHQRGAEAGQAGRGANARPARSRSSASSPASATCASWSATHVAGAEQLNFGDVAQALGRAVPHDHARRPQPAGHRREARAQAKSEAAGSELDAAFEQTEQGPRRGDEHPAHARGDREMFRQVYPFSPALVQTLIAVSSVLQRERTALKVMLQLLVDQRDTLKLGDIVPVGDLFDVIAEGDEAFSEEMAIHFDNAKRLYHQKLLPLLEKQHGCAARRSRSCRTTIPRRADFRNDDRLIKTLLLSALVPEVESLQGADGGAAGRAQSRHDQDAHRRQGRAGGARAVPHVGSERR